MTLPAFTFAHPSNILLTGPSGCGKTSFLIRALKLNLFNPTPTRIVWVYGEEQDAHHELRDSSASHLPTIEYMRNGTDYAELMESFDPSDTNLLVLDDQMNEGKNNANAFGNLFTKGSHHRNITIVYMMQNLFEKGGSNRTINLNAHYLVMFKNPRDARQSYVLGSQMYPKNPGFLSQVFEHTTTTKPHSYLLLDFRQATDDRLRVMTDVLGESGHIRVFNPI
jgi:energy-coupling factor transporter ATP-binding protein EcfA2